MLPYSALPAKRRQIQQLVEEGRLEFTSGTWVMTDEASPHLYSMLDQMIEGKVGSRMLYRGAKRKSFIRCEKANKRAQ